MRRLALLGALLLFLVAVASGPLCGIPSSHTWPAASLAILAASATVLLETRGLAMLRQALLAAGGFGLLFPPLAVGLSGAYSFGPAAGPRLAGVPPGAWLAWTAFLLLAAALADQTRWWVASTTGRRPGPWLAGIWLALLECCWDPALLAEGVLVSHAPSLHTWPLGFTPGFPAFHFMLGTACFTLLDRLEVAAPQPPGRTLVAGAALVGLGLAYVLPSGALAGRWPHAPGLGAALLDGLFALGPALALAALAKPLFAWLLPRTRGRVLLTTCLGPVPLYPDGEYSLDFYSSRFTRGQEPWRSEAEVPYLGAHFLARNLEAGAVVLEYPDRASFEDELREGHYEVVGIGFTSVSRDVVHEMVRIIRRLAPQARIVLGGYGVVCLDSDREGEPSFEGLVDAVCRREGISFLRGFLGEDPAAPLDLSLPAQEVYPLGVRWLGQPMYPLVAGFGCEKRCGFCATSAFFAGRRIPVGSPDALAAQIATHLVEDPRATAFPIFDEDWLADRAGVERVAELLRADPRIDFSRVQLSAFASVASLALYTPTELAGLGLAYLWIGVESKFSPLKKLQEVDMPGLLEGLAQVGICVTASWVLGFDFQTPENLGEDLAWFAGLPATTAQVSLLGPVPGTPLHRQLKAQQRLRFKGWEHQHLYAECMEYRHFGPGELAPWVDRAYREVYRLKGPSLLRMARTWLHGLATHRTSTDPRLTDRIAGFEARLGAIVPVIQAIALVGAWPHHRAEARRVLADLVEAGQPVPVPARLAGVALAAWQLLSMAVHAVAGLPARQPRIRRTVYPPRPRGRVIRGGRAGSGP